MPFIIYFTFQSVKIWLSCHIIKSEDSIKISGIILLESFNDAKEPNIII